jgi:hypothetical protein
MSLIKSNITGIELALYNVKIFARYLNNLEK